jgi:aspartate/methionine/tyrosine aminotransferase
MFYTMLMLIDSGDEVIYPNPGFPIYKSVIKFAGGTPVPMPLLESNDFSVDLAALRSSITDKTKLIVLNSPGNPTGGVIGEDDIRAIADMIRDRDIYVLSDEIYDKIIFDEKPFSIASIPWMKDRTIILDGFSKAYSMTGWRLGYGIMNKDLAKNVELLMSNSNSCASSISQWAALEALKGPQDASLAMVRAFKKRRDYIVEALNSIPGVTCKTPRGAFYAFPNISSFGLSSKDFADRMLIEGGVALSGGTDFGEYGEGYVRISYANSLDNLKCAIERITAFTKKL